MSTRSAPGPSSVLRGHRADVQALCCHPKRGLLYSGDSAGEAKAWDLTTERATWSQRLHPNEAGVTALHIAGLDFSTLLSQGRDGTIKNWGLSAEGLPSRKPLQLIETGSYNFCRMAVLSLDASVSEGQCTSPPLHANHGRAISSDQDKGRQQPESITESIRDGCSNELEQEHTSATKGVPAVGVRELTTQELIVAIAGHDPAVLEIWNMQTSGLTSVSTYAYLPNDARVRAMLQLIQCADAWRLNGLVQRRLVHDELRCMLPPSLHASAKRISCNMARTLASFASAERLTGTQVQQLTQPAGHKHGMCMAIQLYTQLGQSVLYALVGYEDGTVAVWDVSAGSLVTSVQLHAEPVMAVAVAADGSGGICAAADNKVQCFCLSSPDTLLEVLATLEVKQHGIADICIRPDQRLFATAGWDGKVRVFHHKKMRPLAILQYHRKGVTTLAFQPDNQRLISASRDGTIAIWPVFQRETT